MVDAEMQIYISATQQQLRDSAPKRLGKEIHQSLYLNDIEW